MIKPIAFACAAALCFSAADAQQNAGKVVYARTVQMQISFSGGMEGMENALPKTRTDRFELLFANNQTLWKQLEEDQQDEMASSSLGGGGTQFRMISMGSEDVTYCNLDAAKKIDLRELAAKKYIVEDSIRKLSWKLSDETKSILGRTCRKAISQRIGTRTTMTMQNGGMERKEITDTTSIVAWFTTDVPVSTGPGEFQGQLPGLIMEMDINNGRTHFVAVELSAKADVAAIKEPKGGKKMTQAEFVKERNKVMEEMGRNNAGPGRNIRIVN